MSIFKHFDKNNLHHAYLIEGEREQILNDVHEFITSIGIETNHNPDLIEISLDSFKMEDARNLKSYANEKGFSNKKNTKKIFIVSANNFLLEAQNSLLKMFEEPIEDTIFFITVPDAKALLKTFISRFYFISSSRDLVEGNEVASKFIKMPLLARIEFINELMVEIENEDEEGNEIVALDSTRSRSIIFLNQIESALYKKMSKDTFNTNIFHQIFKVREFLRMPGSSTKTLLESVALIIPNFPN